MRRLRRLVLLLVSLPLLTACGPYIDRAQAGLSADQTWALSGEHSIGQTFVAYHDGLSGIELALPCPGSTPLPPLAFSLKDDPLSTSPRAAAEVPSDAVLPDGWLRLEFPPLPDSHSRRLYVEIAWHEGSVCVPLNPAATYRDGAAYLDGQAQETQLAFRLTYNVGAMALGLLRRTAAQLPRALSACLLFLLPGLALVCWLGPRRLDGPSRLILSCSLSVALFPLILLSARTAGGLRLGPPAAWLLLALSASLVLWHARPALRRAALRNSVRGMVSWPTLSLLLVAALAFGTRLIAVGGLAAPLWGDSVEHTMVVQLMLDHGGLFSSWQPYVPFTTFTIHYGFNAAVAFFHWITGVDAVRATVVVGQIMNGLAALALYPLALRLSGRAWAGVAAVAIAGLLSPMPAYYVNWGRYAQLAGQVALPAALWFLIAALESKRFRAGTAALAAVAAAGMFLCQYRVPFFYLAFLLAWWPLHGSTEWGRRLRPWLRSAARLFGIGLGAVVLVLPYALDLRHGNLPLAIDIVAARPTNWAAIADKYRLWKDVAFFSPYPLLALAGGGLAWALVRRRWPIVSAGLWAAALASLVLGSALHVPGLGLLDNFAVLIAWYLPVSLLAGWLVGEVAAKLGERWNRAGQPVAAAAMLLISLWGARDQVRIVQPSFAMVTHADRAAMAWIDANIPSDALFLINGFGINGDTSVVGADAGWWIPLLARRQTTIPPQYALLNETPSEPGYLQRVTKLVVDVSTSGATSAAGLRGLCENGITHLYVGQGQGLVGEPDAALLSAAELSASPHFQVLYHQDRVWVFAFDRMACQPE